MEREGGRRKGGKEGLEGRKTERLKDGRTEGRRHTNTSKPNGIGPIEDRGRGLGANRDIAGLTSTGPQPCPCIRAVGVGTARDVAIAGIWGKKN
jgi:hypothetical protein